MCSLSVSYVSKNLRHRAIFPACVIGNCEALSCFSPRSNLHGQFKKFRLGIQTSVHISGRHHSNHILGLSLLYLSNTSTVNIAQSHLQNITCPPSPVTLVIISVKVRYLNTSIKGCHQSLMCFQFRKDEQNAYLDRKISKKQRSFTKMHFVPKMSLVFPKNVPF